MTQAIVIPTLPPDSNTLRIPEHMTPEEQAQFLKELGKISTEIARVQTRGEERGKFADQRWRAIDARLAKLEGAAEASGQHDIVELQRELDARRTESSKWKWWALSIAATLFTSALVGLIVHFLGK